MIIVLLLTFYISYLWCKITVDCKVRSSTAKSFYTKGLPNIYQSELKHEKTRRLQIRVYMEHNTVRLRIFVGWVEERNPT
jgi:hypothetical protein